METIDLTKQEYKEFCEAMELVLEEGTNLGILTEDSTSEFNSYDPSTLSEATFTKQSTVKLSKEGRKNWLASRSAIAMARAKKDPLYAKLVKYTKLRRQTLAMIKKKYNSIATRTARQAIKSYKLTSSYKANKASSSPSRIQTNKAPAPKPTTTKKK